MSRQLRLRATGAVLAALFVVGPLVANGTAQAELATSARDLVFGGGGRNMLGLSCGAEPRSELVVVESGSTIRVVNATGHKADLLIDGASKGELADRSSTAVLFRRGPVEVALKPDCMLRGPSEPATVTVAPSTPGTTSPAPLPSVDGSSAPPNRPSSPPATGTTKPSSKPAKSRRPPAAATPPRRPAAGGKTTAATRTQARTQRATNRTRTGTTGTMTRTPAGGTTSARSPVSSSPASTGPVGGGTPHSSGPVLAAPEIDATPPDAGSAPAEPVAALKPMSRDNPIGLLALAATVCLAGVTAGAIRAIAAQRASRASMA